MDKELFADLTASISEAGQILRGEVEPSRRFSVSGPDVKALRETSGLSQVEFAGMIQVSVKTLQNWEQNRRRPTGPAAALIRVLQKVPHEAIQALKAS